MLHPNPILIPGCQSKHNKDVLEIYQVWTCDDTKLNKPTLWSCNILFGLVERQHSAVTSHLKPPCLKIKKLATSPRGGRSGPRLLLSSVCWLTQVPSQQPVFELLGSSPASQQPQDFNHSCKEREPSSWLIPTFAKGIADF